MKRIVALVILATLAALTSPVIAPASAASCSVAPVGGENAPSVNGIAGNGTVAETGTQGYKCTVDWQVGIFARYESGGSWHYANETAPGFHPDQPDTFWPANSVFQWPLMNGHLTDPLWVWTPSASYDTPVCAFNWKIELDFYSSNVDGSGLHPVFLTTASAETHKTC